MVKTHPHLVPCTCKPIRIWTDQTGFLPGTQMSQMKLGYGCGGVWGLHMFDEAKAEAAFKAAIDGGIYLFDTGPSYSGGNAEVRMGRFISRLTKQDQDRLILATKVGTHCNPKGRGIYKDYSPAAIKTSLQLSLTQLGVDTLDIVQLHGLPAPAERDAAIETLVALKKDGKIGAIGVSCDDEDLMIAAQDPRFDVVMGTYNILERENEAALKLAKENGKMVLLKSPMAHRLYSNQIFKITSKQNLWYFLRVLKNKPKKLLLGFKYRFVTHAQVLQFACGMDFVDYAIIGSTNPKNVTANVETASQVLSPQIKDRILNIKNS